MSDKQNRLQKSGRILHGRCVCGQVKFRVKDEFSQFYQCHCKQCQQQTGSAFAANLFTSPENVEWLTGRELVTKFAHESRDFSNGFCANCGSPLPYVTKSKKSLIVPAGCLDDMPTLQPQANIFGSEQAEWYEQGSEATKFKGFQTDTELG